MGWLEQASFVFSFRASVGYTWSQNFGLVLGNLADGEGWLLAVVPEDQPKTAVSLKKSGHVAPLSGSGNTTATRGQGCYQIVTIVLR